jgi:arginase
LDNRWIVTPYFFEQPEPALASIAPTGASANTPAIAGRSGDELAKTHRPIREFIERILAAGDRPVSLAGDCCAALPVLSGLQHCGIAPTLVWFDAHGDFNTPDTSPSQFLGGMPLAMIAGRGPQWLCDVNGLAPLDEQDIVLAGARNLDPLERQALEGSAVRRVAADAVPDLPLNGPVHLHFDTDVIDADECAAFNYPVPGGPGGGEMKRIFDALAETADIRAVSISGWTGALDGDGAAARLFARILSAFGAVAPH